VSTDSEIIRRSLETPSIFAELFERHARVVGAFAARRFGRDAAADIVSETMLVAFRKRGRRQCRSLRFIRPLLSHALPVPTRPDG